jgi:aminomethyltransferase
LRRKALIYDVPEKPLEISGPDVVPFLEKVFARTISSLQVGRGRYAIACTPRGGVFMDGVLFKLADDRYWYVQADGAMETWFIAHSGGFDVTITDPNSRVIQIQGPASFDIMNAASAGAISEEMRYFHAGFFDLGGQQLYVSRTGFTNELGFDRVGRSVRHGIFQYAFVDDTSYRGGYSRQYDRYGYVDDALRRRSRTICRYG